MSISKSIVASLFSAGIVFAGSIEASSQCPASPEAATLTRQYSGAYKNFAYGFSVEIPPRFIGRDVDNPLYQRGFALLFSDPQESITVYADINSLDWSSVSRAAAEYNKAFTDLASRVSLVKRKSVLLNGRAAIQSTAYYSCPGDQIPYSSISIVSLSLDKRFMYTLRWEGKKSEFDEGSMMLKKLAASWRFSKPTS